MRELKGLDYCWGFRAEKRTKRSTITVDADNRVHWQPTTYSAADAMDPCSSASDTQIATDRFQFENASTSWGFNNIWVALAYWCKKTVYLKKKQLRPFVHGPFDGVRQYIVHIFIQSCSPNRVFALFYGLVTIHIS